MSQESRFLEAREARAKRSSSRRQSHHDNLHEFWTSLRRDLSEWEARLDVLVKEQTLHNNKSTLQRKECANRLDILLKDLQTLRRNCLSSTDVPELPPADVRLLHQEFTARSTKLDQVREELIPTTKFTFKRYRAAMKQRQEEASNAQDVQAPKETVSSEIASPTRKTTTVLAGNVIQNYINAILMIDSSGKLTIQPNDGSTSIVIQQPNDKSSSLLLQNLEECQVTINGNYKALHIQNVSMSTIHVVNAIDGAIHVTACSDMQLFGKCHQLRMHESTALKCHVHVGSGPILEDCTEIVFYARNKQDLVYDTKDFNWLRNGVPSPNFCVVEKPGSTVTRLGGGNEEQVVIEVEQQTEDADRCYTKKESPDERAALGYKNISTNLVALQSDDDDDDEL